MISLQGSGASQTTRPPPPPPRRSSEKHPMAAALPLTLSSSSFPALQGRAFHPNPSSPPSALSFRIHPRSSPTLRASVSSPEVTITAPDDLVESILSKVSGTDRGVSLLMDGHKEVGDLALQLGRYCVDEPVRCPLIFGDWDVLYCSNPTSPGGGYRSAFGRLVFKATEMVQVVETPDIVRNKVSFTAFGFLGGEVSLKGKLKVLDSRWIQVIFEPPVLKIGTLEFQYGGKSEVKLEITYIDEKIRLGKGSRGSLFVFLRR